MPGIAEDVTHVEMVCRQSSICANERKGAMFVTSEDLLDKQMEMRYGVLCGLFILLERDVDCLGSWSRCEQIQSRKLRHK